jgi:glycogen debranching enzyme
MAFEITVGPPHLSINSGWAVLTCEPDCSMGDSPAGPGDRGLYWRDTRLLSGWRVRANGVSWTLLNSATVEHYAIQAYLTNEAFPAGEGEVSARTIGLAVGRTIGADGMHEDLDLANHGLVPVRFKFSLRIESDFVDIFDVKQGRPVQRGRADTVWHAEAHRIETHYHNESFHRGLAVTAGRCTSEPVYANGWLTFDVALDPGARWHTCLEYAWLDGEDAHEPPRSCFHHKEQSEEAKALADWQAQAMGLETSNGEFQALYHRSVDDLAALRLPLERTNRNQFVPAAGIPWFAALFGRDSLITAAQTVLIYPDFARGALDVLGRWQATGFDASRDMQPGKILHELRHGELAQLGLSPYRPYYGTADASLLYPILLHLAWQVTGDQGLLDQHVGVARRCLEWARLYGDRDGDGFQEYLREAPQGADNQGWKDSGNAIVDEHGRQVEVPRALCELQGYHYDALRRMAKLEEALGRPDEARALSERARELYERFNAVFWDEAAGAYALCLDGAKRPVMTVASNQGHLLWSGIVPEDRAERVARRLLAPDMWSGWGIRTLSAENPAYNPYDYQLGAVWPHDNGIIALGLKSYGFSDEAAMVARGIVEAGSRFLLHRLPEVYASVSSDRSHFPVQYLGANVPRAWAAGSVFALLQALVGMRPEPATNTLAIDPALPEWLPELALSNISVGPRSVTLRLRREGDGSTSAEIGGDLDVKLVRRRYVERW